MNKGPFTEEELEYLCKFWDYDGQTIMAYALDRTEKNLRSQIWRLKKSGKFDYYKNLRKYYPF